MSNDFYSEDFSKRYHSSVKKCLGKIYDKDDFFSCLEDICSNYKSYKKSSECYNLLNDNMEILERKQQIGEKKYREIQEAVKIRNIGSLHRLLSFRSYRYNNKVVKAIRSLNDIINDFNNNFGHYLSVLANPMYIEQLNINEKDKDIEYIKTVITRTLTDNNELDKYRHMLGMSDNITDTDSCVLCRKNIISGIICDNCKEYIEESKQDEDVIKKGNIRDNYINMIDEEYKKLKDYYKDYIKYRDLIYIIGNFDVLVNEEIHL